MPFLQVYFLKVNTCVLDRKVYLAMYGSLIMVTVNLYIIHLFNNLFIKNFNTVIYLPLSISNSMPMTNGVNYA
jgi:hypothetical protein